jgi:hypothetical protein
VALSSNTAAAGPGPGGSNSSSTAATNAVFANYYARPEKITSSAGAVSDYSGNSKKPLSRPSDSWADPSGATSAKSASTSQRRAAIELALTALHR